jgi:acyl carrier protein
MSNDDAIRVPIREFILREFLPGENPDELTDDTELLTTGILDSIATIKLVAFLEEQFGIQLEAYEVDVEHLNRIRDIAALVASKRTGSSR